MDSLHRIRATLPARLLAAASSNHLAPSRGPAMRIVVLDGYTLNPGDLSWADLEALGP